jgi:hypothetical protein
MFTRILVISFKESGFSLGTLATQLIEWELFHTLSKLSRISSVGPLVERRDSVSRMLVGRAANNFVHARVDDCVAVLVGKIVSAILIISR